MTVASLSDGSLMYTMQPATSRNALMLDNAGGNTTGRFTLASPTTLNNVMFCSSSGNGAGVGLMHRQIGGYRPGDIEIVAAFDIDRGLLGPKFLPMVTRFVLHWV